MIGALLQQHTGHDTVMEHQIRSQRLQVHRSGLITADVGKLR